VAYIYKSGLLIDQIFFTTLIIANIYTFVVPTTLKNDFSLKCPYCFFSTFQACSLLEKARRCPRRGRERRELIYNRRI